jgi:uncharacterized protein YraI
MNGRPQTRSMYQRCVNLFFVFALVVTTAGAALFVSPGTARAASAVTTSALNLRKLPSTSSGVRRVMPAGSAVEVVRQSKGGFYYIIFQGSRGYAHGDYLDFDGSSNGGGGGGSVTNDGATGNARTTSSVNLRAGPSTSNRIILEMPANAALTLTGERSNGFLGVVYKGSTGWAYGDYIGSAAQSDTGNDQDPGSGNAGSAVTTSALNLRSGPTTSSRVLLVMPSGAQLTLTGNSSGGFLGVIYNGTSGWASSTYIDTSGGGGGGGSGSGYDTNGDGAWSRDEIIAIIYASADYYGQSREAMLRVAVCESNLNPNAVGPAPWGATGLFQFLAGTWASTPYAADSIYDPVANAFAAGWMWSVGRRGEWVCQ